MTTSNNLDAISSIASSVSALAACAALIFLASQNRNFVRSVSYSAVQKFQDDSRCLWETCRQSSDDSEKFGFAVSEILTLFEFFCIQLNSYHISDSKLREHLTETICDYIDKMSLTNYGEYTSEMCSEKHVCRELKDFVIQNRKRFTDSKKVASLLCIPNYALEN